MRRKSSRQSYVDPHVAPVRTWLLTIARRVCAAEISTRLRDRQLAARLAAMPSAGPGQVPEAGTQAPARPHAPQGRCPQTAGSPGPHLAATFGIAFISNTPGRYSAYPVRV
jgi:hypothetical protein